MFPAAQSHHKHVTIMLTTLLYPTVHLAMRVESQTWVEMRGCVCVCVRELVMEGVRREQQASLPLLPQEGL